MHSPIVRSIVRKRDGHDRRRDDPAAHVERPARRLPGPHRRQDGPHVEGRLVRGRRGAAAGLHDLCGHPRQPDARGAQRRPRPPARVGRVALQDAHARRADAGRARRAAVRALGAPARRAAAARPRRPHRPPPRRARRRAVRGRPPRAAWTGSRPHRGLVGGAARSARGRSSPPAPSAAQAWPDDYAGTRPEPCTISGGSCDSHRHPQRGHRPHAHRAERPARAPAPRERELHVAPAARASTSPAR